MVSDRGGLMLVLDKVDIGTLFEEYYPAETQVEVASEGGIPLAYLVIGSSLLELGANAAVLLTSRANSPHSPYG